jgi:hypothetical protein
MEQIELMITSIIIFTMFMSIVFMYRKQKPGTDAFTNLLKTAISVQEMSRKHPVINPKETTTFKNVTIGEINSKDGFMDMSSNFKVVGKTEDEGLHAHLICTGTTNGSMLHFFDNTNGYRNKRTGSVFFHGKSGTTTHTQSSIDCKYEVAPTETSGPSSLHFSVLGKNTNSIKTRMILPSIGGIWIGESESTPVPSDFDLPYRKGGNDNHTGCILFYDKATNALKVTFPTGTTRVIAQA